jgi:hypothetical protein
MDSKITVRKVAVGHSNYEFDTRFFEPGKWLIILSYSRIDHTH